MYSLTLSQNFPERHDNGTFLYNLVKIAMYFDIFGHMRPRWSISPFFTVKRPIFKLFYGACNNCHDYILFRFSENSISAFIWCLIVELLSEVDGNLVIFDDLAEFCPEAPNGLWARFLAKPRALGYQWQKSVLY